MSILFEEPEMRVRRIGLEVDGQPETAEIVDAEHMKTLGILRLRPTLDGPTFVAVNDREFELGRRLLGSELDDPKRGPRAVILRTQVKVEGQYFKSVQFHHATEVDPGTYAGRLAELARQEAVKAEADKRRTEPHPVDLAELYSMLAPRPTLPLVEPSTSPTRSILSKRRSAADAIAMAKAIDPAKPIRGIEAIQAFIEGEGIRLSVVNGQLLATGTTMTLNLHSLIKNFESLLVGRLTGKPVPCALKHDDPVPAWTLAVPNVPICQGHLRDGTSS